MGEVIHILSNIPDFLKKIGINVFDLRREAKEVELGKVYERIEILPENLDHIEGVSLPYKKTVIFVTIYFFNNGLIRYRIDFKRGGE